MNPEAQVLFISLRRLAPCTSRSSKEKLCLINYSSDPLDVISPQKKNLNRTPIQDQTPVQDQTPIRVELPHFPENK
jgi:hypothetical protein